MDKFDIIEMYEPVLGHLAVKLAADLFLLERDVKPHYSPSQEPFAMVVGASMMKEATLLRFFHEHAYNIPQDRTRVAACTIRDYTSFGSLLDNYDFLMDGGIGGDARDEFIWANPLMSSNINNNKYDFVYIRNPDMEDLKAWHAIFTRGLSFTMPEGVLVTLIRDTNEAEYKKLLEMLDSGQGIRPIHSALTGMERPTGTWTPDQHYLLGVFKPDRMRED